MVCLRKIDCWFGCGWAGRGFEALAAFSLGAFEHFLGRAFGVCRDFGVATYLLQGSETSLQAEG